MAHKVERDGLRKRALALALGLFAVVFMSVALPIGKVNAAASDTTKESAKSWCDGRKGTSWEKKSDTKHVCKGIEDTQSNRESCAKDGHGEINDPKSGDNKFQCVWNGKFKKDSGSNDSGSDSGSSGSSGSDSGSSSGSSGGSSSGDDGETYGARVSEVVGAGKVECENGVKTSIIGGGGCYTDDGKGGGVYEILLIILNILTAGVGVLGVVGLVISGITYLTARDNEQQVAKAKSRILQIVIGLAIFALLYVGLQWLIPGGIFGN